MRQIKIIDKTTCLNLERGVNDALKEIDDDNPSIKYMLDIDTVVIEYTVKVTKLMCADCIFYDSTQSVHKAWGVCQCNGKRLRFNCNICNEFKDIRG